MEDFLASSFPGLDYPAASLVHEHPAGGSGTGVEVLVATPYGGIDVPIVKAERDVPDCVGEIPDDEDVVGMGEVGYGGDVEERAGVELNPGEEDECGVLGVLLDD